MKKILLSALIMLLFGSTFAQNVNLSDATAAANNFFQTHGKMLKSCAGIETDGADTLFFVFNADNGFVVISGDKRVQPVLAFSDHQLYNSEDVIPPVKMWLNYYREQLAFLKKEGRGVGAENSLWNTVLQHQGMRDMADVAPLMQSHWGQGTYYNYYCPRDVDGENNRVVTGCVATAMAQLMYYFRFPETGIGSYSYLDSTYGVQSADYGATTYNFEAMSDEPTAINAEISTLMHHCGVGVDMVYGPDGSGMYNHSAARVLRTFFKYSPETEYLFRDSTDLNWDSVIVSHLDRQIPMYYAGWSLANINGHGFICDGYKLMDSCYYFHFNFGWDGSYDGYFYSDGLTLMGTHFNFSQELIVNAYPDTVNYDYPVAQPLTGSKTLTTLAGSFTDGTLAAAEYRPNMDYSWIISPQADNVESITLDLDYDVAEGDTLWVTSPAVNTFYALTADSGSIHISWDCSDMTVRFVTDDSTAASGFRASYNATVTSFCSQPQYFTTPTGSFSDGSGDDDYNALSNCEYRIVLPSYSAITLHFQQFDLQQGDYLYIYKLPINNDALLASYTGTMPDTTIVFDEKRLVLLFESDAQDNAAGFQLEYAGGHVGVEEFAQDNIAVAPNPATNILRISALELIDQVTVRDIQGRILNAVDVNDMQSVIPVSNLSAGIYMLQIRMGGKTVSRKFVKQ
ncbi:MAG: C10 family peptidase [Bacteroidales bacterium]|nr:C10 family peptidase [Bacteroidales bacterium]